MFDLNTIVANAFNQAIEQATKPLLERITALESQALAARLSELEAHARLQGSLNTTPALAPDHFTLHRLDTRLAALESQIEDVITAEQVGSLIEDALSEIDWEDQVQDVLDGHNIEEQVKEAIDELVDDLRITRI